MSESDDKPTPVCWYNPKTGQSIAHEAAHKALRDGQAWWPCYAEPSEEVRNDGK